MEQRSARKERRGTVVSNRMQKTVVVSVERTVMHPKYKKYLRRSTKVKAHDEKNECRVGDQVLIVECRPISREKRWRVRQVLGKAATVKTEGLNTATSGSAV
ncbi:MAG: 30S ribosomal protein S17 [Deltaproteobacteria bacterium]|nr:30S ribosomal protein S17 [Deltaproteobacteria bacterium]